VKARPDAQRVVITGIGAVTPVGLDVPSSWAALLEGQSGAAPITLFDATGFDVRIACEVKNFDPLKVVDAKTLRNLDRSVVFGLAATREATADAGIEPGGLYGNGSGERSVRDDVGVIFGTAAGGVGLLLQNQKLLEERGPGRITPSWPPNFLADATSGQIAIHFGFAGPNMAVVSACATGGHAIGEAAETIRRGVCPVMVAGGTEAVVVPIVQAAFTSMRVLATDNEHPEQAMKPFDLNRDGFVNGEGAGALVLESLPHALERGAHIYGEVVGYGSGNDAFHMAISDEAGAGPARTMRMAMRDAGLEPDEVDYINPHGTATPLNDRTETLALHQVFGAAARRLMISSTKSMTGHMLGAAGAVEAIWCLLAMRDRRVPPTINLTTPDPACDLDYVPNTSRSAKVRVALDNAIGLGGHNSCIALAGWAG
jgi:beta-ketoacyl-acyl-carrier-protein synthase II